MSTKKIRKVLLPQKGIEAIPMYISAISIVKEMYKSVLKDTFGVTE